MRKRRCGCVEALASHPGSRPCHCEERSDDPSTLAAQATPGWSPPKLGERRRKQSSFLCCGKAGLLRFARNDVETQVLIPATRFRPGLASSLLPPGQRAQGRPGADCARSPVCVGVLPKCTRVELQVQPRHPGLPRAMFYGLYVLSPGKRPFLPPLRAGLTASVAPGSRRQDHTISPYAAGVSSGERSPDASRVHRIPAQRVVTSATSLSGHGMAGR